MEEPDLTPAAHTNDGFFKAIFSQPEHATAFFKSHLPPVLPFVFHQGPETWNISAAFEDLFELPDELAADLLPFLPKFHHALLDLSRSDPDTEEDDTRLRVVLQLMKLAR